MSRETAYNFEPITGPGRLIDYVASGEKSDPQLGVGTEHEAFGLLSDSLTPITYSGDRGLQAILEGLVSEFGWQAEFDRGLPMALVCSDGGAVSLEPGGQLELSGRVNKTIQDSDQELDRYLSHVQTVSQRLGIRWVSAGCHPTAALDEIGWVPKSRYELMAPYLATKGSLAHNMMRGTCTIQANFDYRSESDCAELVTVAAKMSPFVSAIFANSAVVANQATGMASFRCNVWRHVDRDRCGTPAFMLDGSFTYAKYIDYLLDIPLMYVRRENGYTDVGGVTFRQFIEKGDAVMGDWELHLSTVFPDIRIKRFAELRTADGGNRAAINALPAFWKGIVYCDQARSEAHQLLGDMSSEAQRELYDEVCRLGIRGTYREASILDVCQQLVKISEDGLARQAERHGHDTEVGYLSCIRDWLNSGRTLGDRALAAFEAAQPGDKEWLFEPLELK
ncbi:MAG: hypothetical protein KC561_10530 [Myxococcales bacterium]|nr:hypothetical protein [Myxococcales bacterium]